jgi:hypothetical protein
MTIEVEVEIAAGGGSDSSTMEIEAFDVDATVDVPIGTDDIELLTEEECGALITALKDLISDQEWKIEPPPGLAAPVEPEPLLADQVSEWLRADRDRAIETFASVMRGQ